MSISKRERERERESLCDEEEGYGRETQTEKREERGRVKDEEANKRKEHPHTMLLKSFSSVYLFCVQMLSKLFQSRPTLRARGTNKTAVPSHSFSILTSSWTARGNLNPLLRAVCDSSSCEKRYRCTMEL